MIDIGTGEAKVRVSSLPDEMRDDIERLAKVARRCLRIAHRRATSDGMAWLRIEERARVAKAALNAAIVAAFEPLTAPDQSEQVARILGGDA